MSTNTENARLHRESDIKSSANTLSTLLARSLLMDKKKNKQQVFDKQLHRGKLYSPAYTYCIHVCVRTYNNRCTLDKLHKEYTIYLEHAHIHRYIFELKICCA